VAIIIHEHGVPLESIPIVIETFSINSEFTCVIDISIELEPWGLKEAGAQLL